MLGTNLVKIELSTRRIIFTPSNAQDFSRAGDLLVPDLEVTITNTSQQFASFQLALYVEGQTVSNTAHWYQVEPNACAKKPPGDRTTFLISLLKAPVATYDTTVPLILKVFSAELADFEATEPLYVQIQRPDKTLRVYLPVQDLSVYPGTRLRIPVLLYNLEPMSREISLRLKGMGLELNWFPNGIEQSLQVEAGGARETEFCCAPPPTPQSLHQVYTITVDATDRQGNNATAGSYFEILPFGQTKVEVVESEQIVPAQHLLFWKNSSTTASFLWRFENQSNVRQHIYLRTTSLSLNSNEQFTADRLTLSPADQAETALEIKPKRPWLGWMRTRFIEVFPELRHPDSEEPISQVTVQPASQVLTLKVKPVIPLWLQLLVGLGCLWWLWWLWLLSPRSEHRGPVNSVILMANGDTVVSGSRDQTLRRWQVNRAAWLPDVRRLHHLGKMQTRQDTFHKAIRVVENLPADVKQVAVGLESGEIQLWNIDPPQKLTSFFDQSQPDRVFDLAFTRDSLYLFSGHGSGTVRRWAITDQIRAMPEKIYLGSGGIPFAISAIDVIEQRGQSELVAIAGQFNRLVLWDWRKKRVYDLRYDYRDESPEKIPPVTSRNSYLTSLDVADKDPLMVTADNVGLITTWDVAKLKQCLSLARNTQSTTPTFNNRFLQVDCSDARLDHWQAGERGSAIRQVSLTDNGCYLASTGDDGRISLWRLASTGNRQPNLARVDLATFKGISLNSVDIHLTTDNVVLVAADTPGNRVQLYRKHLGNHGCQ